MYPFVPLYALRKQPPLKEQRRTRISSVEWAMREPKTAFGGRSVSGTGHCLAVEGYALARSWRHILSPEQQVGQVMALGITSPLTRDNGCASWSRRADAPCPTNRQEPRVGSALKKLGGLAVASPMYCTLYARGRRPRMGNPTMGRVGEHLPSAGKSVKTTTEQRANDS